MSFPVPFPPRPVLTPEECEAALAVLVALVSERGLDLDTLARVGAALREAAGDGHA